MQTSENPFMISISYHLSTSPELVRSVGAKSWVILYELIVLWPGVTTMTENLLYHIQVKVSDIWGSSLHTLATKANTAQENVTIQRGLYTSWVIPYGLSISPWIPYRLFFGWVSSHFFSPYPLWNPWNFQWILFVNPCTSPYGIFRDLIRIVINVFKHNLIPLFVYNKWKNNNCMPQELNPGLGNTCSQML